MPKIHETWEVLPHTPLQEIDDGILTVAGDIPMPLGNFPRRMTVVRLSGGRSLIFSAIALPEPEMARIEALGEPSILVIPNGAHRLDARAWKQRYPELRVLAPAGAREEVSEVVPVDATATDILDDPDVRFEPVAGTEERESALVVHRPTGHTLVCNDIIGHVRHPNGMGAQIMARIMGFGVNEPQIPRVAKLHIKSPKALAAQLRGWAALENLRRIIVSHGDPITEDPAGQLQRLANGLEH